MLSFGMRGPLCLLGILLLAGPARGQAVPVTIRGDVALRGVPRRFLGVNVTGVGGVAGGAPCCTSPLSRLGRPPALWRVPGAGLAGHFHFLNGIYDGDAPDPDHGTAGVDLDRFARAARLNDAELLLALNFRAGDQELLNLIAYANGPLPQNPPGTWTETTFRQQDRADDGYFPWLRRRRGWFEPIGIRYAELGADPWKLPNDVRCHNDAGCYGRAAADLFVRLRQADPELRLGLAVLTLGRDQLGGGTGAWDNRDVYAGFHARELTPDFVADQGTLRYGYGPHTGAQAEDTVRWADRLADAARRTREELAAAFPKCGATLGMFLSSFALQGNDAGPEPFEAFTPWATAAVAHFYAAALHGGYAHASYSYLNGDPGDTEGAGPALVRGHDNAVVDANYWGLWFAARFLEGAVSELEVTGLPPSLRGFAVHRRGVVRLLLVNTSASAAERLAVTVTGRSPQGAVLLGYPADVAHGGLAQPFTRRAQVPQDSPPAQAIQAQDLSRVDVPPLSTVLVEIDVGRAAAPPGQAAAAGCALEDVSDADLPDLRPGPDSSDGRGAAGPGCSCRAAPAPQLPSPLLLAAAGPLLFRLLRRRRA